MLDRSALVRGLTNRVAALEEQVGQLAPDIELETNEPSVRSVAAILDAEVVSRERVAGLREQVRELIDHLEAEIHHHSA